MWADVVITKSVPKCGVQKECACNIFFLFHVVPVFLPSMLGFAFANQMRCWNFKRFLHLISSETRECLVFHYWQVHKWQSHEFRVACMGWISTKYNILEKLLKKICYGDCKIGVIFRKENLFLPIPSRSISLGGSSVKASSTQHSPVCPIHLLRDMYWVGLAKYSVFQIFRSVFSG